MNMPDYELAKLFGDHPVEFGIAKKIPNGMSLQKAYEHGKITITEKAIMVDFFVSVVFDKLVGGEENK